MTILAVPLHTVGKAPRLALFYAAAFLVVGIQLPFWPVLLAGRGLDAQQIASVFAAAIWAKVVAGPVIGASPTGSGARRGVMIGLAAVSLVLLCGAVAGRRLRGDTGAQPGRRRGAIGADAAGRQHHPGGGAARRARLRPGAGLGLGHLHPGGGRQRRLAAAALPPAARPAETGAAAGAGRLGGAAARLCRDAGERAGGAEPRSALGGAGPAGRRPRFLAVRRQRRGVAGEPPALLRLRHALLARTRLFRHGDRRVCGPRGWSPRSCCSGTARRWSPGSGRSG